LSSLEFGLESWPVGLAVNDEVIRVPLEAVDGGLCSDRVREERYPFIWSAVGSDDGGEVLMALREDVIGITGFQRVHLAQGKVINDEEVDGDESSEFLLMGSIKPGVFEGLEHSVSAYGQDGDVAPTGSVANGVSEEGFSDANGSDECDIGGVVEKAEREDLIEEFAVIRDLGGVIPTLQVRIRFQTTTLGPQGCRESVPSRGFIGEDLEKEVLVGHLVLAGQCQAFRQDIQQLGQSEAFEDGFEFCGNDVSHVVLRVFWWWKTAKRIGLPGAGSAPVE
jgi:hypothetical protein